MDKQRPPTRVGIHRRPLEDASSRANSATPPSSRPSDKPSAPHHERLKHRKTSPKNSTGPIVVSENQQASVTTARPGLTSGERKEIDNKRASAISNTSSTASANGVGRKSRIGPWQLGKTIGRGGCSTVRAVRHTVSGQFAAAKIVSKKFAETARAQSLANLIQSAETDSSLFIDGKIIPVGLEREIVIMKLLEHKNIVRLYDVWENHNQLSVSSFFTL